MGDDHCGAVQLRDNAGHCEGFSGAGDAEQSLTGELFLESVDELGDGGGLVSGGRIGGVQLEFAGSRRDGAAARLGTELNRNRMGRRDGGFGGHGGDYTGFGSIIRNTVTHAGSLGLSETPLSGMEYGPSRKDHGLSQGNSSGTLHALSPPVSGGRCLEFFGNLGKGNQNGKRRRFD